MITLSILEATNWKHAAEQKILEAIREFVRETRLEVRGVELELTSLVGQRHSEVTIVTLDVRFP